MRSIIPGFTITHRCTPCRTFASEPGRCSFCDEVLEPVNEEAAAMTPQQPACPDWPDEEPDTAERAPTVRQAPRTRTRTRRKART